jgi:hypothetical protein
MSDITEDDEVHVLERDNTAEKNDPPVAGLTDMTSDGITTAGRKKQGRNSSDIWELFTFEIEPQRKNSALCMHCNRPVNRCEKGCPMCPTSLSALQEVEDIECGRFWLLDWYQVGRSLTPLPFMNLRNGAHLFRCALAHSLFLLVIDGPVAMHAEN